MPEAIIATSCIFNGRHWRKGEVLRYEERNKAEMELVSILNMNGRLLANTAENRAKIDDEVKADASVRTSGDTPDIGALVASEVSKRMAPIDVALASLPGRISQEVSDQVSAALAKATAAPGKR